MEISYPKLGGAFLLVCCNGVGSEMWSTVFRPSDFDEVTRAWWRLIGFCENRNGSGEMRPVTDKSESGEWGRG